MKKYSKLLLTLVLAGGIVGCVTTTQVNIPEPTAQQVRGAAPLMEKISIADRATFESTTFEYMSDNLSLSYHKFPIGDFLLGHLVAAMPKNVSITSIQLQKFSGKCIADGYFVAQTVCEVSLAVMVEAEGSKNIIVARVNESPGPWVSSFGTNYAKMSTDGEGEKIMVQVGFVLRSLATEFANEYKGR